MRSLPAYGPYGGQPAASSASGYGYPGQPGMDPWKTAPPPRSQAASRSVVEKEARFEEDFSEEVRLHKEDLMKLEFDDGWNGQPPEPILTPGPVVPKRNLGAIMHSREEAEAAVKRWEYEQDSMNNEHQIRRVHVGYGQPRTILDRRTGPAAQPEEFRDMQVAQLFLNRNVDTTHVQDLKKRHPLASADNVSHHRHHLAKHERHHAARWQAAAEHGGGHPGHAEYGDHNGSQGVGPPPGPNVPPYPYPYQGPEYSGYLPIDGHADDRDQNCRMA